GAARDRRAPPRARAPPARHAVRGVAVRAHPGEGRMAVKMRPAPAADGQLHTADYLRRLGVPELPPRTSPFDPGYDPVTLESHLAQSAHLVSILKISMACWLVADERATRRKLAAARRHRIATVTGGGPFEVAVAQGVLPAYLDL